MGLPFGSGGRTPNAASSGVPPRSAESRSVSSSSAAGAPAGTETVNVGKGASPTRPNRASPPSTARSARTFGGRRALYANRDAAPARDAPNGTRNRARATDGTTAYRATAW